MQAGGGSGGFAPGQNTSQLCHCFSCPGKLVPGVALSLGERSSPSVPDCLSVSVLFHTRCHLSSQRSALFLLVACKLLSWLPIAHPCSCAGSLGAVRSFPPAHTQGGSCDQSARCVKYAEMESSNFAGLSGQENGILCFNSFILSRRWEGEAGGIDCQLPPRSLHWQLLESVLFTSYFTMKLNWRKHESFTPH